MTLGEPVPLRVNEGLPEVDALTLTLKDTLELLDTREEALGLKETLGEPVPFGETEGEEEVRGEPEPFGETEGEEEARGEPDARPLELELEEVLREREGLPVRDGEGELERDRVVQALTLALGVEKALTLALGVEQEVREVVEEEVDVLDALEVAEKDACGCAGARRRSSSSSCNARPTKEGPRRTPRKTPAIAR